MSRRGKRAAAEGERRQRRGARGKGDASASDPLAIRVRAHPRARLSIRRVRAQAGIAAFAITLLLAHRAGVPALEALLRALAGGMLLHLVAWAVGIALWKRLILVELETAHRQYRERLAASEAGGHDPADPVSGTVVMAPLAR